MAIDYTKFPPTIPELWDEYNYNTSKRTTNYIKESDWGLFYNIAQDKLRTLINLNQFNIWNPTTWNTLNATSKELVVRALARLLFYYFNATDLNIRQGISITQGQVSVSKSVPTSVEPMIQQEVINFLTQAGIYNNAITLNLRDNQINSGCGRTWGDSLLFSGPLLPSQTVLTLDRANKTYLQDTGITSTDNSVEITRSANPNGWPQVNLKVKGAGTNNYVPWDNFKSGDPRVHWSHTTVENKPVLTLDVDSMRYQDFKAGTSNVSWVHSTSGGNDVLSLHVSGGGSAGKQIDGVDVPLYYDTPNKKIKLLLDRSKGLQIDNTGSSPTNKLYVGVDTTTINYEPATGNLTAVNRGNAPLDQFGNGFNYHAVAGKNQLDLKFKSSGGITADSDGLYLTGAHGGGVPIKTFGTGLKYYGGSTKKLTLQLANNSGLKVNNGLSIFYDPATMAITSKGLTVVGSTSSIKIDGKTIADLKFGGYGAQPYFTLTNPSGVLGQGTLNFNGAVLQDVLTANNPSPSINTAPLVVDQSGGIITTKIPTDGITITGNSSYSANKLGTIPQGFLDSADFEFPANGKVKIHSTLLSKINSPVFNIGNVATVNKLLSKTDSYNRSLFLWTYSSNNTIATMDLNGAQLVPKFGNLSGTSSVHKYTLMPLTFGADNPNKKVLFGLKVDTDTMEISGSGIEQKLKAKLPVFDTADMEKRAGGWGLKNLHRIKLNNIFSTNNLTAVYPLQKSYTSSGNLTTYRLNYASSDFTVNASHELALSSAIKTAINGAKSNYLDVQAGTGIHVAVDRTKTPHEATVKLSTQFLQSHSLYNTNIIKKSNITAGSNYMSVAKGGSSISDNTLSYDLSASTKTTLTKVGTNETNIATQTGRINTLNTSVTSHITNGVDRTNRFQFDLLLNNATRHTLTGAFSPLESYITTTPSLLHFHIAYTFGGVRRHFDKTIYTGYFDMTGGTAGASGVANEYYFPLGNWFPGQHNSSSMLVIHYLASSNVWVVAYLGPSIGVTARIVIDRFPSRYNMR